MTLTYLDVPASGVANGIGSGSVTIGPDVGQYWCPLAVHIGTGTLTAHNGAFPMATLFLGPKANFSGIDAFDSTFTGQDDTSTLISGTVLSPGQALKAQWTGCFPNDNLFMHVVGLYSDMPPAIGIIPSVPGARFSGANALSAVGTVFDGSSTAFLVSLQNTKQLYPNQEPIDIEQTINAGSTFTLLPASGLVNYFLHDLGLEIDSAGITGKVRLESSTGTALASFIQEVTGAPTNAFYPPQPHHPFSGAQVGPGLGVQLHNTGTGTIAVYGYLTYSQ